MSYQTDTLYSDEQQQMLEQRASLLQEMTSDLSDIRQLEHEIKRMSEEIQATGKFLTECINGCRNAQSYLRWPRHYQNNPSSGRLLDSFF